MNRNSIVPPEIFESVLAEAKVILADEGTDLDRKKFLTKRLWSYVRDEHGKKAWYKKLYHQVYDNIRSATMASNDATPVRLSAKLNLPNAAAATVPIEGCYICHLNNHQDQILLCEHCNGEYHTYCLQPPLQSIPEYDWYCDNCIEFDPIRKHLKIDLGDNGLDDGLDRQVNALPYSITKRFGEIVFAQGGTGYGWWPCQIYDPRLAIDPNVRQTAQKHLYTRYLVYFFNCTDISCDINTKGGGTSASATHSTNTTNPNQPNTSATGTATPFSILAPKMIKSWVVGLSEDLYFGRAAKNHGKQRYRSFCDAFQLACIEHDKSINNTLVDQQRRYILNTFVYPKTDVSSEHLSEGPNAITTKLNSPSPEKRGQEAFLLPSPTKRQPSETTKQQGDTDKKISATGVKKQRENKKKRKEKINWIRLPCLSRKRYRPTSTKMHDTMTRASENCDDDSDDLPHPAFTVFESSNRAMSGKDDRTYDLDDYESVSSSEIIDYDKVQQALYEQQCEDDRLLDEIESVSSTHSVYNNVNIYSSSTNSGINSNNDVPSIVFDELAKSKITDRRKKTSSRKKKSGRR